ncbi:ABC transporter substrate-binding protein [Paenibacillus sp. JDR-2]|uniref:ABC transporter substrate-binding protein n=1 Tax=Paenibacillus sp. (strain JDR-2) TaxID=324057 RepID=UPI0001666BF7|nr:ABC transporter substrate-binding protein [Paenibacillus sp. JDR-2]ACT01195.1 extracellular solute-binding protein family 1 [Paenibacillus sp. JDR-2]
MKRSKKALSVVFASCLMFSMVACSNSSNESATKNSNNAGATASANADASASPSPDAAVDPMAPYKDVVNYTVVKSINQDPKFPAGQSYEKNAFQDYVEKTLNVKGKLLWTAPSDGDQYAKKLSLDIASNRIPDIFPLEGQTTVSMLNTLVQGDMIEDLTPYFEKYASQKVKDRYAANKYAFDTVNFGGKMMAIPYGMEKEQPMLVWVREDWRKKLNLPEPKTIDDIRTISKAFTTQDPDGNGKNDTLGLVAQSNSMYSSQFDLHTLDTIYWAMNAFPATWEQGEDGVVKYGGIQPEAKAALSVLRDMYKEGSLDKEYGLKDGGKTTEDVSSGRAGMVFEAWYAPYYPLGNTIHNNPNADWKAYALLTSDGKLNIGSNPSPGGYMVVKKGFAHPELLIQLINLSTEFQDKTIPELVPVSEQYQAAGTVSVAAHAQYVDLSVNDPALIYNQQKKYNDILAGKADESILLPTEVDGLKQLQAEISNPLENILKGKPTEEELNTAIANRIGYLAYNNAMKVVTDNENNIVVTPNVYGGQTETMTKSWADLQSLQKQTYLKIILGTQPLDSFDTFVSQWKAQGGDKITTEVQAEVDKRK